MPLMHGKSEKAFKHNVRTEMHEGKPQNQSLAIAYALKRRAKKMAEGGEVGDEKHRRDNETSVNKPLSTSKPGTSMAGHHVRAMKHGKDKEYNREVAISEHKNTLKKLRGQESPELYAEGGVVPDESPDVSGTGLKFDGDTPKIDSDDEFKTAVQPTSIAGMNAHGGEICEACEGGHCTEHIGGDSAVDRIMAKRYSQGGRVANDTPPLADSEENDFDDLALRDDLESSYTGKNSGDELGNAHTHEQDEDTISRIMRSRAKKDRMPRPA